MSSRLFSNENTSNPTQSKSTTSTKTKSLFRGQDLLDNEEDVSAVTIIEVTFDLTLHFISNILLVLML